MIYTVFIRLQEAAYKFVFIRPIFKCDLQSRATYFFISLPYRKV